LRRHASREDNHEAEIHRDFDPGHFDSGNSCSKQASDYSAITFLELAHVSDYSSGDYAGHRFYLWTVLLSLLQEK
jgi:hypothetical protein